uniref:Solute carrier family 35 member A1 n=1 Tax=Sinocyclocheilus grahami TaxID=75366 RepID=A0A672NEW5_SINGR
MLLLLLCLRVRECALQDLLPGCHDPDRCRIHGGSQIHQDRVLEPVLLHHRRVPDGAHQAAAEPGDAAQGDGRLGPVQKRSGQPHFQESQGAAEAERAVGRLRHPEQHGLRGLKQPGCRCLPGDVSAEDPLYSPVYSADARPLSEPAAVVFSLHAVWRSHTGAVDAAAVHQSPGGAEPVPGLHGDRRGGALLWVCRYHMFSHVFGGFSYGALVTPCFGSGVYFEKVLKSSDTSLWVRNIQMYLSGIVVTLIGVFMTDGAQVLEKGFFYGYTPWVCLVIFLASVGGMYTSVVVKYTDNIMKGFSAAAAIVLSTVASVVLFGLQITATFLGGALLVCVSIYLYGLPKQDTSRVQKPSTDGEDTQKLITV